MIPNRECVSSATVCIVGGTHDWAVNEVVRTGSGKIHTLSIRCNPKCLWHSHLELSASRVCA